MVLAALLWLPQLADAETMGDIFRKIKVAPMADSDTVRVGDQVMIVRAPYGLSHWAR